MRVSLGLIIFFLNTVAIAETPTIAVATNFNHAMNSLVESFEAKHKFKILVSYGSTGSLYAQIINGAPFDAFFSADTKTIERLVVEKKAIADTRFNYANGSLVFLCETCTAPINWLKEVSSAKKKISIANPKLAPYGLAAMEALNTLPSSMQIEKRLIYASNVGQAFQFIRTHNAPYGIVSKSLVIAAKIDESKYQSIPKRLYKPIIQSAAILKKTAHFKKIHLFFDFLKSKEGRGIIQRSGYTLDGLGHD